MKKNVIILTNGLSGSSVLTGLIARGGYWLGDETAKKQDYDTFENADLVRLNRQLFHDAGYAGNYSMVFDRQDVAPFLRARDTISSAQYSAFVDYCEAHRPWLWKDPRLWLTIHYWESMLNLDDIQFVLFWRDPLQTWISTTIRRQIQTYRYLRNYIGGIRQLCHDFLDQRALSYLELTYEDLIVKPERSIARINSYLGCNLTVADLQAVFSAPLYKKQRGTRDLVTAALIYLKNYRERYR